MVITDLGVFTIDRKGGGMTLIELASGVTLDDIKAKTEASLQGGQHGPCTNRRHQAADCALCRA